MGLRSNTLGVDSLSDEDQFLSTKQFTDRFESRTDLTPKSDKVKAARSVKKTTPKPKAGVTPGEVSAGFGIAGAVTDILNANFQFNQIEDNARLNIMLANFQIGAIRSLGKEQALQQENIGFERGQQALLKAAAQGQDVSGSIATSAQLEEERFGIFNAIAVETNAIAEAFGIEAQIAALESGVRTAEIQRDLQIFSSVLSGAAGVALLA